MTESEMNALREMFVDVAGAMGKGIQDQLGAQITSLEKSVNEVKADVSVLKTDMAEVKGDVKIIVARLDVSDADVRDARVRLALLTRAKA